MEFWQSCQVVGEIINMFNLPRGFALFESLLTMVIVSITLLALVAGQKAIMANTHLLTQRNEALNLAESKLAELHNISANSLNTGQQSLTITGMSANYSLNWNVQNCTPSELNCKTADIWVTWQDQNAQAQRLALSSRMGNLDLIAETKLLKGS